MKYNLWLKEWLKNYIKPTIKERTFEKYSKQIENHLEKELGKYPLEKLSIQVLQNFVGHLLEKKLAQNTISGIISIVKCSLKKAVVLGHAKIQGFNGLILPKAKEKQIECFSVKQQRKIEKFISESKKTKLFGIVLCLYTGIRIGELLALTWQDLDIQKQVLSIKKSCYDSWQNGKYTKIIDTPKTQSSYRLIPLPKQLMPKIKELKKQAKGQYIVEGKFEDGMAVRSYQKTFSLLLKKLKLSHKGFHSLRHTFSTRALECGMDVRTLSEILGHSNPTITLKRYTHSMLEHKIAMMNKLGKLLF